MHRAQPVASGFSLPMPMPFPKGLFGIAKQVTELSGTVGVCARLLWGALWIFLCDAVLPVGCRIGSATEASKNLLRNVLVSQHGLVVPLKVKLARDNVVIRPPDASACESLRWHVLALSLR